MDTGTRCWARWVAVSVAHAWLFPQEPAGHGHLLQVRPRWVAEPSRGHGMAQNTARQPGSAPLSAVVVLFVQVSGSSEWKEVSVAPSPG